MKDPIIRGYKQYTEHGVTYRICAKGGLHKLKGNSRPYFSLTGDIDRVEHGRWVEDSGGCIHEQLLEHWPELKPLALLHLSDDDGVPMHDAANGWYWMAGAMADSGVGPLGQYIGDKGADRCLQIFADYVRIDIGQAAALREEFVAEATTKLSHYQRVWEQAVPPLLKAAMKEWCDAQRPRWKREAEDAIRQFGLVTYGD